MQEKIIMREVEKMFFLRPIVELDENDNEGGGVDWEDRDDDEMT